jgi:GNAT superfamily N-acetyltransferase
MKTLYVVQSREVSGSGVRISISEKEEEVGHTFVYVLQNDLHKEPFGFLEDVFVEESHRGKGWGTKLVELAIDEAKRRGCYKLIGTSRSERCVVHQMYEKMGFSERGKEFRMDL